MDKSRFVSFLDYIEYLVSHIRIIILNGVLVAVVAFGITSLLPRWYEGEVEIMPPQSTGGGIMGMAASLAGGFSLTSGGEFKLPFMTTPSDLYSAMVKSRAVIDPIIDKYSLQEYYRKKDIDETRKKFLKYLTTSVTSEGIVEVKFLAKRDPVFSAAVANDVVKRLDEVNRNLLSQSAKSTREFVGGRLAQCRERLAQAERSLAAFQKEHKAISIEDQMSIMLEFSADMRAKLMQAELERDFLKEHYLPDNPRLLQTEERIKAIEKKIESFEEEGSKFREALVSLPDLWVEYSNLLRDVKVQEILYEFLLTQYEQAKIQEQKDTPVIQVLSWATVPEHKVKPKRAVVSLVLAVVAVLLTILYLLCRRFIENQRIQNPHLHNRWIQFENSCKRIFTSGRQRKNERED